MKCYDFYYQICDGTLKNIILMATGKKRYSINGI